MYRRSFLVEIIAGIALYQTVYAASSRLATVEADRPMGWHPTKPVAHLIFFEKYWKLREFATRQSVFG